MTALKTFLAAALAALCLSLALPASAQELQSVPPAGPAVKCEGPSDVCGQMAQLQAALENQKKVSKDIEARSADEVSKAAAAQKAADEKEKEDRMAKFIAAAAVIAIALRSLITTMQSWKGYFKTDKSKAWMKVGTLGIGFLAFVFTNIGFGIPWWQALIIAGGAPGAILVNEIMKLVPVLKGQKPMPKEPEEPAAEEPAAEEPKA